MQMQMPNAQANQNVPPHQSWGPPPQVTISPSNQPPLDKQPLQGPPTYGRDASMGVHTNVAATTVSGHKVGVGGISSQLLIIQSMQIPGSYAVAVIGTSGEKISYIRRASCAIIAIQETKGVPGEMTVKVNGSASEVHTAQQLIQNFIVEADGKE
ncbi:hypothetical protein F0562_021172 [Nyssa sinensis]|uniref:K Homology domain-containing protein n=1 Tax=Nyssa sinensis TaxID=561372 RepID=A0A5J5BJV0_9ASTE|nr:hypothetical protein F0562_021172 [Nyssa sinensis]